jgi:hypothetical protein
MARYPSSALDLVLGKRFAKRVKEAEKELSAASTIRADEADAFNDRYGQEGKAPRYADEDALHGLAGPEGKVGVMYQSFRKKIMYEPDQPDVMIRRKRKWWGKTAEQHVDDIPGKRDADGKQMKYVSQFKLMRGDKTLIDSRYDVDGKLLKETVNLSNGRAQEQWDRDTKGRLIRTHFSTERLRDGILFSPVTETMSALKDGKRIVTQQKGQRVDTYDRDEATGKLTITGRKGFFGEKNVSFKPDGSIGTTHAKRGIFYTEDVKYKSDQLKVVTTKRLFRSKKIRSVELTIGEMEHQRQLKEAKQRATTENVRHVPPPGHDQDNQKPVVPLPPPLSTSPSLETAARQQQNNHNVTPVPPAPVQEMREKPAAPVMQAPPFPPRPTPPVAAKDTGSTIPTPTPTPTPTPPIPIPRLGSRTSSPENTHTSPPITQQSSNIWTPVPKLGATSKASSSDLADNNKKALMESLAMSPASSSRSSDKDKGKNALAESLAMPAAASSHSPDNAKGKNVETGSLSESSGLVSRFARKGEFEKAHAPVPIPRKPVQERPRDDYGR